MKPAESIFFVQFFEMDIFLFKGINFFFKKNKEFLEVKLAIIISNTKKTLILHEIQISI